MMFLGFIMMTNIITALGTFSVAKLCHVIRLMFKTNAASFLDGFSNEPSYEFIGEATLKINLV